MTIFFYYFCFCKMIKYLQKLTSKQHKKTTITIINLWKTIYPNMYYINKWIDDPSNYNWFFLCKAHYMLRIILIDIYIN